jgi:L-alanine-DL-glutamate epimerase-like enolase superfamily enzyme
MLEVTANVERHPLARPFRIARAEYVAADVVLIGINADGTVGFGEAAPDARFEEDLGSTLAFIEEATTLLGADPFDVDGIDDRLRSASPHRSGRAAIDAALLDLRGKLRSEPAWKMLGVARSGPPTTTTVWLDDPDAMARRAERAAEAGYRRLKVKLGGRDGLDVDRMRAIRSASTLPAIVDVNEYWSFEEALETIPALGALGVTMVEQPLPEADPAGPALRDRSPLPIYVDEDCRTLKDIPDCTSRAHGINIKLSKAGGVRPALAMAAAAREEGLGVMIGSMLETGLGIAAACLVASACDHADIDANLLLERDPWTGVRFEDGVQVVSLMPGLGVLRC